MTSMKITKVDSKQSRSILPLLITDSQGNSTWGTSIHYTRNILITNQHVIEPYSSNTRKEYVKFNYLQIKQFNYHQKMKL